MLKLIKEYKDKVSLGFILVSACIMPYSSSYASIPASGYGSQYQNNVLRNVTDYNPKGTIPMSSSTNPNAMIYADPKKQYTPVPKVLGTSTTLKPSTSTKTSSGGPALGKGNSSNSGSIPVSAFGMNFNSQSDYEAYKRLVDESESLYGDVLGGIDRSRQNLNASKSDFLNTFTKPYESQVPLIQQSLQEGLGGLESAGLQAAQQEQSALDAARRLYNELTQRNTNLFGTGAGSSVGQAASELLNRDQYRSMGDIRTQGVNARADIQRETRNLQERANAQLQSIELQKQQALSQAELAFRDKMDQLDQLEMQTRQNRGVDKMNLLREYRAQVANTNAQAQAYQQQIAQMAYQAQLQLANSVSDIQGAAQNALNYGGQRLNSLNQGVGGAVDNLVTGQSVSAGGGGGGDILGMLSGGYRAPGQRLEEQGF